MATLSTSLIANFWYLSETYGSSAKILLNIFNLIHCAASHLHHLGALVSASSFDVGYALLLRQPLRAVPMHPAIDVFKKKTSENSLVPGVSGWWAMFWVCHRIHFLWRDIYVHFCRLKSADFWQSSNHQHGKRQVMKVEMLCSSTIPTTSCASPKRRWHERRSSISW